MMGALDNLVKGAAGQAVQNMNLLFGWMNPRAWIWCLCSRKEEKMEIKRLIVGMVQTNCYIAVHPETKEAVIVDPGDEAARIEECTGADRSEGKGDSADSWTF